MTAIKFLKTLTFSAVSVALAFAIALSAPQIHNSYLRSEVGDSVVQVLKVNSRGGGTGFAIQSTSGKDYIATNAHVCALATPAGWMRIKSDRGFESFKKVVYVDKKHDICLIEGDRRLDALDLGSAPKKGEQHWIIGHPGLRQLTLSQGEFVGMDSVQLAKKVNSQAECSGEFIELEGLQAYFFGSRYACIVTFSSYGTTAVAYGGNSGSPVVNKYGNVIGILFAGSTEQERDNHVVPLSELQRVLRLF